MSVHKIPCHACNGIGSVNLGRGNSPFGEISASCDECGGSGEAKCSGDECLRCFPACEHGLTLADCGHIDHCDEEKAAEISRAAIAEAERLLGAV